MCPNVNLFYASLQQISENKCSPSIEIGDNTQKPIIFQN